MEKEGDAVATVDPLGNYWGLSLFPSSSIPPSKPYNTDQDLHTIHTHLTSMALRSPAKLVQQAKTIVNDNPELFNSENLNDETSQKMNDETSQKMNDAVEDEDIRRPRRPGLGLNLQRFSMRPTKKPSVESLLPTLDLDRLKDPAEFFMAHERLENAKREIQKQLGGASFESEQDNAAPRPWRQRRPGLLGNNQLQIEYKHRYPRETFDSILSSQETLGSQSPHPVAEDTDKDEAFMTSSENEVKDSSATEGNKLDELLDGLLRCNSEDLEGDGAINILHERLQIKPISLKNKISVPDFPDNQVMNLKSLQGNKSKPRKALSDIDNLLKGMNNKTPLRKAGQSPVQQLASPTPPRSPFASVLSLQKRISRSRKSVDPFSAHEIGHLSAKIHSPTRVLRSELNLVDSGKPSNELNADVIGTAPNELNAPSTQDINVVGGISLAEDTVRNSTSTSQKDNSREPRFGANIDSNEHHVDMDVDVGGIGISLAEDTVRNSTSTSPKDNSREPRFGANIDSNEHYIGMDVDVGGSGMGERVMDDMEDRSNNEAHIIQDVITVGKASTVLDADINCTNTSEISKEDNSGKSSNKLNAPSIENVIAVCGTSITEDTVKSSTGTSQKSMVDNSRESRFDANIGSNESHVDMDLDVGSSGMGERVMDDTEDRSNIEANKSCQSEDKAENHQTFTASIPTDDTNLNVVDPLGDQSNSAGYEANVVDKRTRRSDDDPEHCLQEKTDSSVVPPNRQKRVKLGSKRVSKDKILSKRQSLAAAGTTWTDGLRRSSRMRTRPLEYWKGERQVYARVHESLATVIGVRCVSPGSNGKPTMKVKSYISDDKYKEVLEVASLY